MGNHFLTPIFDAHDILLFSPSEQTIFSEKCKITTYFEEFLAKKRIYFLQESILCFYTVGPVGTFDLCLLQILWQSIEYFSL